MALRLAMARNAGDSKGYTMLFQRCAHAFAQPPPLDRMITQTPASQPLILPGSGQITDTRPSIGSEFLGFYAGAGSMEVMAVPKRKTSPHKRGIRNGPKALKPVPVIVRCKVCGRVKLPHFFCCSGLRERENPDDAQNDSTS